MIRREVGRLSEVSFSTPPITQAEAHSIAGMLSHKGHYFSFASDSWSDRGLGLDTGSLTVGAGGLSGAGQAALGTSSVTYNPEFRDYKWTVCYARDDGITEEHIIVRSDGAKWVDGVSNDAATTSELVVSNGAVALTNAFDYSDLMFLPFNLYSEHALPLYTYASGGKQSTLNPVVAAGDLFGDVDTNVIAVVTGVDIVQSATASNLAKVSITLKRVAVNVTGA